MKTLERLMRHVLVGDGCWEWTGYRWKRGGYGQTTIGGRRVVAHRALYTELVGPVPSHLSLDHLCRNRSCVRPSHLEPVTQRENVLRGEAPAARQARQTHCSSGHPLTGSNLVPNRHGRRWCRECRNRRERERKRALYVPARDRRI